MKILGSSLVLIITAVFSWYSSLVSVAASEGKFPEKPITIIVPYGAGGGTDFLARTVADEMKKHVSQPVVVMNRTGGGGAVGVTEVVRAKPDGYTVGVVSNSALVLPHLQDIGYKSSADFQPIIGACDVPLAFTVNAKVPWKTLDEFIAAAKASPGKLKVAVASLGIPYLDMALFMDATGIQINLVTTSSDAENIIQVLGGHVDAGLPSTSPVLTGHLKAGAIRILGLTSEQRYPGFQDVPTFAELGYKNASVNFYLQVFGPKGMPEPVLKFLHDSFKKAMEDEAVKTAMINQCYIPRYRSTADLTKQMAGDDKLFGDLVKRLKLKQ